MPFFLIVVERRPADKIFFLSRAVGDKTIPLILLSWQAEGRPFLIVVERQLADKKMFLSRAAGDKNIFLYFLILAGRGQAESSYRGGSATGRRFSVLACLISHQMLFCSF